MNRPRVLVFAYACEPGRGSEPGAGWGLVRAVAEFADCTVLVGPEHTRGLEAWKRENPSVALAFQEVPEPRWARPFKRHRIGWFLVYLAWLRRAYKAGAELHRADRFDLVYHATYSTYWLPAPLRHFSVPRVWGPVGGAVTTPLPLWRTLGPRGVVDEVIDEISIRGCSLLPATRRTWSEVDYRILQNEASLAALPVEVRKSAAILNHVLFIDPPEVIESSPRDPFILFFSHLEARKGPRLAVRALATTPQDVRLLFVGDGPERRAVERLAKRLGVGDRVEFRGRLAREEIFCLLGRCAAALFTGLREEGGVALAEAMLSGCAVIVLANGGARTVAEASTDPTRVALVAPGTVAGTARALGEQMVRFSRQPPEAKGPLIDQVAARAELRSCFSAVLSEPLP